MVKIFTALSARTTEEVFREENDLKKAMGIVIPIFVYRFLDIFIVSVGAMLVRLQGEQGNLSASFFENNSQILTVIIKLVAMFIATSAVYRSFINEKPVLYNRNSPKIWLVMAALLGISASVFLNQLFYVFGLLGKSEAYAEVSAKQYALGAGLGVIVYGIVAPLAEEILYRGIIFNRLRRSFNIWYAFVFSSLVFGIMHGNMVQAIYGTIFGFIIAWVYERFGGFIYPYIMHACANTCIYLLMQVDEFKQMMMSNVSIVLAGISTIIMICLVMCEKEA